MKKKDKVILDNLMHEIKSEAKKYANVIGFIKDYGNLTKRKNHKLKLAEFKKCRDFIYDLVIGVIIYHQVIKDKKRLVKKYRMYHTMICDRLREEIKNKEKP